MGTSAIIKIEGSAIKLYKHYDGDPKSTLPWLQKFNKEFTAKRGNDPEYKVAQLVRSSVSMAEEFTLDPSTYTGWGLTTDSRVEGDFTYTLWADGEVTSREIGL